MPRCRSPPGHPSQLASWLVLILNNGADSVAGTFSGLAEEAVLNVSGQPFRNTYSGGRGSDVILVRGIVRSSTEAQFTSSLCKEGTFRLLVTGSNTASYGVPATTNFNQWTNIGFATPGAGGRLAFADTNAFKFKRRC